MTISGATFTFNAIVLDYPIVEAITAALEVCDEVIVQDMQSTDNTVGLLKTTFDNRVKVVVESWPYGADNPEGTYRTNLIRRCTGDWIFLFDADEVLPEWHCDDVKQIIQKGSQEIYSFTLFNLYRCLMDKQYKIFKKHDGINCRPFIVRNRGDIYFGQTRGSVCPHALLVDSENKTRLNARKVLGHEVHRQIKIYHYGQCRYGWAIAKTLNFWANMYEQMTGEAERKYDENTFELSDRSKRYPLFTQSHPKVMDKWISKHI